MPGVLLAVRARRHADRVAGRSGSSTCCDGVRGAPGRATPRRAIAGSHVRAWWHAYEDVPRRARCAERDRRGRSTRALARTLAGAAGARPGSPRRDGRIAGYATVGASARRRRRRGVGELVRALRRSAGAGRGPRHAAARRTRSRRLRDARLRGARRSGSSRRTAWRARSTSVAAGRSIRAVPAARARHLARPARALPRCELAA